MELHLGCYKRYKVVFISRGVLQLYFFLVHHANAKFRQISSNRLRGSNFAKSVHTLVFSVRIYQRLRTLGADPTLQIYFVEVERKLISLPMYVTTRADVIINKYGPICRRCKVCYGYCHYEK